MYNISINKKQVQIIEIIEKLYVYHQISNTVIDENGIDTNTKMVIYKTINLSSLKHRTENKSMANKTEQKTTSRDEMCKRNSGKNRLHKEKNVKTRGKFKQNR